MKPPVALAPGPAAGYALLRAAKPAAVREETALIWVEGPDAAGFLQGLLSNDIAALAPGGSCAALILDAKGHIRCDPGVHRDSAEAFTLTIDPRLAERAASILRDHHFSEDIEIIGPEAADLLTIVGGVAPPADVAQVTVPGLLPGSVGVVVDDPASALTDLRVEEVPAAALELARIAAGVPRVGLDTGPSTLVQEVGLESRVSFGKGCYLGQETVARVAFRGKVNRRLRGLALPGAIAPGARLEHQGREVGTLTSVGLTPDLGAIGLAVLRQEVDAGDRLAVEGHASAARVVELPFPPP